DLAFEPEARHEPRRGHEIDVRGIEHQFDAHQDADGVALEGDAEDAAAEEQRGEHHVMEQARLGHAAPAFFLARARYAAAISTTSRCTETISNGNKYASFCGEPFW